MRTEDQFNKEIERLDKKKALLKLKEKYDNLKAEVEPPWWRFGR